MHLASERKNAKRQLLAKYNHQEAVYSRGLHQYIYIYVIFIFYQLDSNFGKHRLYFDKTCQIL